MTLNPFKYFAHKRALRDEKRRAAFVFTVIECYKVLETKDLVDAERAIDCIQEAAIAENIKEKEHACRMALLLIKGELLSRTIFMRWHEHLPMIFTTGNRDLIAHIRNCAVRELQHERPQFYMYILKEVRDKTHNFLFCQ